MSLKCRTADLWPSGAPRIMSNLVGWSTTVINIVPPANNPDVYAVNSFRPRTSGLLAAIFFTTKTNTSPTAEDKFRDAAKRHPESAKGWITQENTSLGCIATAFQLAVTIRRQVYKRKRCCGGANVVWVHGEDHLPVSAILENLVQWQLPCLPAYQ